MNFTSPRSRRATTMRLHKRLLKLLLMHHVSTCRAFTSPLITAHNYNPQVTSSALQMCQLMGINAASLTDFRFSFRGFARRGGATDIHSHGWGMCFYDGRGLRAFHDAEAASESLLAEFLTSHPIKVSS